MKKETNRIIERLNSLGQISDDKNCLSRFYGTEAHRKSGDVLIEWMEKAGMTAFRDDIGNIRGLLKSSNANAKHFMMGSHYDTVFNAGKYDGPLGILLGLEVAQRLYESGADLPFHLNIVAFADEEGSRFNTAYFGSSVLAGCFDKAWLNRKDDEGHTVANVIEQNGGDTLKISEGMIPQDDWLGYFEPHIEQGPVLCDEDLPVCLVSGIAAQNRINVEWQGVSGHAGTYPMNLRHDALCAAAEFVLEVEKLGKANTDKMVATVGKFTVKPNTSNVIPGAVTHSIDLRSSDDEFLAEVTKLLEDKAEHIAKQRALKHNWVIMQSNASVICDDYLTTTLGKSIKATAGRLIDLPSGAGHDAVMISKVAPVSMLFIRCKEGISHNPLEYVTPEDINDALKVCVDFVDKIRVSC